MIWTDDFLLLFVLNCKEQKQYKDKSKLWTCRLLCLRIAGRELVADGHSRIRIRTKKNKKELKS